MPTKSPTFSIILAAGKGTRMRSNAMHKVCFPIDGVPAINRAIATYNACGIRHHIVVVGNLAGQVVETVGQLYENVSYVYQAEQLGTAHATRMAVQAAFLGDGEELLIVAGDRLIDTSVLEQLFDQFYTGGCDLMLLATPHKAGSTQGRLVQGRDGRLLAIVEDADIRQRRAFRALRERLAQAPSPTPTELRELLVRHFTDNGRKEVADRKFRIAFGALWEALAADAPVVDAAALQALIPEALTAFAFTDTDDRRLVLTPDEVDRSPLMNNSVYLVRMSALTYALEQLNRHNAQGEEYLSEIVTILAHARKGALPRFTCRALTVERPDFLMGFNDPAELLEVEAHLQARKQRETPSEDLPRTAWYRPVSEWQAAFDAIADGRHETQPALWNELNALYGREPEVIAERVAAYRALFAETAERLGPETTILLVRSPGRINVLSRHIDHQGGNCNLMTIGYETLMAVHARNDDRVNLSHVDKVHFGDRQFAISELVQDLPWDDWLSLVNSEKVSKRLHTYGGDWSQYITASVLRLQKKFSQQKLRGMDLVVTGNVPMAAGLSSSSSLVVGAADATIAVNNLVTFPSQVVDLCGEGEWFVGTRGGAADHAAVKLGQKGRVIQVTFFDFAVQGSVPFPDDYLMAVCDSGIRAQKSANAKDQFNHRIACYRIGFQLIRRLFPQFRPILHHLRDVNVRNLHVPLSWIYRILLHLPEQATRDELRELLPDVDLAPFFATHQPPPDGLYPIRGVVLFGLAECERARLYADYLTRGQMADIGKLMAISHDGDRVASHDDAFGETPYLAPTSNSHLLSLMDDLESGDPERVLRAQLQWQPGSYHCSVPPIDRMVDIALRTPGVAGAQLAGAGLGGCMMVLAHRDAIDQLIARLDQLYYRPQGKPHGVLVCKPIAGAGVLLKDG